MNRETISWSRVVAHAASILVAIPVLAQAPVEVTSPDGRTVVSVATREGGLFYAVDRDDRRVVLPSRLGFEFRGAPALRDDLELVATSRDSVDETWSQPWGETATVRNHYNEARVSIREAAVPHRRLEVVFRVFDDGLGFRYELPEQPALGAFEIMSELTEFHLAEDARAWWIPTDEPTVGGYVNLYQQLYRSGPMSTIATAHTPLTMEMPEGMHIVIHEANLVDYAEMTLTGRQEDRKLRIALPAWADGVKVRGVTPFETPWRTIQLADRAEDLHPAVLGLNLNPSSRIDDISWIEPMKYVGIWWGMHIGTMTWYSGPKHGATNENARRYIDFAAENGLGGVLVEGWNVGWEGDWINSGKDFSFTEAYPDFDLEAVADYAGQQGVSLIGHHETGMGVEHYERQLEDALSLYQGLGVKAVKTGYVGGSTTEGHAHRGQYMVRHYRKVVEEAARHRIMVNAHEPVKDTGERRTWPNMMTREGARGQEFNAWAGDGGNPPEHETILFFTRMMAGPMDFTPGIFDILIEAADGGAAEFATWALETLSEPGEGRARPPEAPRVRTTLAKQLALYVVLYSPHQMAADLPENYHGHPAFQFIRDVPVDWERTEVLEGKIGDYVVVARRERGGSDWYVGAITDEEARTFSLPLSFLESEMSYVAEIYADAPEAHWRNNPLEFRISRQEINAEATLTLELAPGGGQAIRVRPAQ